jgi:hypothetical protein
MSRKIINCIERAHTQNAGQYSEPGKNGEAKCRKEQ